MKKSFCTSFCAILLSGSLLAQQQEQVPWEVEYATIREGKKKIDKIVAQAYQTAAQQGAVTVEEIPEQFAPEPTVEPMESEEPLIKINGTLFTTENPPDVREFTARVGYEPFPFPSVANLLQKYDPSAIKSFTISPTVTNPQAGHLFPLVIVFESRNPDDTTNWYERLPNDNTNTLGFFFYDYTTGSYRVTDVSQVKYRFNPEEKNNICVKPNAIPIEGSFEGEPTHIHCFEVIEYASPENNYMNNLQPISCSDAMSGTIVTGKPEDTPEEPLCAPMGQSLEAIEPSGQAQEDEGAMM